MLTILVGATESFDHEKEIFVMTGGTELQLEHSLVSLSKWEQIFEKPFLGKDEKTTDEILAYIRCMIISPDVPEDIVNELSADNFEAINTYINAKRTATWFIEDPNAPKSTETITAELIYFWMFTAGIPMECQHWHLNNLFTEIRIFNEKHSKPKKMSQAEIAQRNRELNARRRAELGSKG